MSVAPSHMQQAMILGLHSGQREGDVLEMTWNNYDGSVLTIRQNKTGRKVYIPCSQTLKSMLDKMDWKQMTILTFVKGLPWGADNFRHKWAAVSREAGIKKLKFQDLRGTTVTILTEQGCSNMEIASITGHKSDSVQKIIDVYASRTKALAQSAILKFENDSRSKVKTKVKTKALGSAKNSRKSLK